MAAVKSSLESVDELSGKGVSISIVCIPIGVGEQRLDMKRVG